MLCEKCHKKEAAVFYEETVNGKARSLSLCADCAHEMGHTGELGGFALPFGAWQDGLFGSLFGLPAGAQKSEKSCPACGATFRSFSKDGKVGCPACYRTFSAELADTVYAIHGNVKHIGRVPTKYKKKEEKKHLLTSLREQMKAAVETEDFEQAAAIRDQIKALEEGQREA